MVMGGYKVGLWLKLIPKFIHLKNNNVNTILTKLPNTFLEIKSLAKPKKIGLDPLFFEYFSKFKNLDLIFIRANCNLPLRDYNHKL
ncbi:hypothetical protein [Moraxella lacunata]|uniref:Uncharacterized protein n=1 Tax=Moraxella lacunata TaxID=477 RepID=A0A1B8Q7X7_MORLA|nr:hypothetical protein A9Z63_06290 [Moraxella lacunata]OBX67075.1 hypothetical protein A9309_12335 [Moraxella lacunata]